MCAYTISPEARVFVVTGTPIQPHSSDGLAGLDVKYSWIVVPHLIWDHCGFPDGLDSIHKFCSFYGVENPVEARMHAPLH